MEIWGASERAMVDRLVVCGVILAQLAAASCLDPMVEPRDDAGNSSSGDGAATDRSPGHDAAAGSDAAVGNDRQTGADAATGRDTHLVDDAAVGRDTHLVVDAGQPVCIDQPGTDSPAPPIDTCNYMDWSLSADGYYLISNFGTTADGTTLGRTTSCGYLRDHYAYNGCQYDVRIDACKAAEHTIPWVQGHVDYDYDTVIATVDQYAPQTVPFAEYFYVAGAQRFNCGSVLRVTNILNDLCVVVYAEDGGPGSTYEDVGYGARRILDSSPAVTRFLEVQHSGWANSDLVYVEWGLPGDVPGQPCQRCQSNPAALGFEGGGTPFDVNDMMTLECRPAGCGDGFCSCAEDHASCPADCGAATVSASGSTVVDDASDAFKPCGDAAYWRSESAGYDGGLIWTYATDNAVVDNYAVWELHFAAAASCQVEAYTDAAFGHSQLAGYQVRHAGGEQTVIVDQTAVDGWNPIGSFGFAAGGDQWLRLDDNTGEPYADRVTIAYDAIRLICQ